MNFLLRKHARLFLLVGSVTLLLPLLIGNDSLAQLVWGVGLVFILPGFALTNTLLPTLRLGFAERLLLIIGSSLAFVVLTGVFLDITSVGIWPRSWLVGLGSGALILAIWAMLRQAHKGATMSWAVFNLWRLWPIGLALLLLLVALQVARTPAPNLGYRGYTMLWMLPDNTDRMDVMRIGVESKEFTAVSYKLQVKMDGAIAHEWPSITIRPNERWENRIELTHDQPLPDTIRAELYRLDAPEALYRYVVLTSQKEP
jgi:uncharacterized membrane protein